MKEIRKSNENDIREIASLFDIAREYMVANGNPNQWGEEYPNQIDVIDDIASGNSYVILENGKIVGCFSLVIGLEENYQVIKDGKWRYDLPYGTIHRLASNGKAKGIARACFDYCAGQIDYLRIDTHEDNKIMQAAMEKYGFHKCGIIYVEDHTERIAYDYIKKTL